MTIDDLKIGQSGTINQVGGEGPLRLRFLDMGLIPGTRVTCLARSPAGDPCAYLIRGALIALRRADADGIQLERRAAGAVGT